MVALGLHCCARAFSTCDEQGLLSVVVRGLPIVLTCCGAQACVGEQASAVAVCGSRLCGLPQFWHTGSVRLAGPEVALVHGLSYCANCDIFPDQELNYSDGRQSACNTGDPDSIPGLRRSPVEGKGYLLQYSCLENPMDRGGWQATVHGITKSWTGLSY